VAVLDRGRRERYACLEAAFDHIHARPRAVFAVVRVHAHHILGESKTRDHSPDHGLDSLASFLA